MVLRTFGKLTISGPHFEGRLLVKSQIAALGHERETTDDVARMFWPQVFEQKKAAVGKSRLRRAAMA